MNGHHCTLISRNGNVFKSWPQLQEEIAHSVRAQNAILDGEICCLDAAGRPNFKALLFRRDWPVFYAFDVLSIEGEDLRHLPLLERKRRLRKIMPRIESRVLPIESIVGRGEDLFRAACELDLEGIVGKWAKGTYSTDPSKTSWVKIRNPAYSQMDGRRELFERRRDAKPHNRAVVPELRLS